jgi:hypothetical protein
MDLKLTDEILKQASNCPKNHRCLSNQQDGRCRVYYSIEEIPFLMIKNQRDEYCPYTFVYGEKRFCTCPVKIELYHRYGI